MIPKNDNPVNWNLLIQNFVNNCCTKEEFEQLISGIQNETVVSELTEALKGHWNNPGNSEENKNIDWDSRFKLMMQDAKLQARELPVANNQTKTNGKAWIAVAASVLLVVLLGYLYVHEGASRRVLVSENPAGNKVKDINPGSNKAVLTLADGSTIVLDSAQNGRLVQQGNSNISKVNGGQIRYSVGDAHATEINYNTVSTPRGGQYRIDLADGSKVWLNAASSLKFPTAFSGKTRNVILTGEGYFEVSKDHSKPFQVIVNDVKVEVLGTHFNVNAYNDEDAVATTLLEGSVKIMKTASALPAVNSVVIKPGQRGESNDREQIKVVDADVEEAVAWKNGKFQFNSADIQTIMRQIGRWYDVNIEYEGQIPKRQFTGKISRDVPASKLISMLEYASIHLRIEGKNIVVTP